jgi:hypothetical protein
METTTSMKTRANHGKNRLNTQKITHINDMMIHNFIEKILSKLDFVCEI